jgi:hypothetical protein
MDPKSKVWLLAGAAAALAGGVTWKILHHRDVPTQGPAAEAAAPAVRSDTSASSSIPGQDRTAAASRPDSSGAVGGAIGAVIGGSPNSNAALHRARGIIVSHSKHSLVLATPSDGRLVFEIPKTMEQTTGLEKGQSVVVGYTEESGHKIAKSITRSESHVAAKPAAPNG